MESTSVPIKKLQEVVGLECILLDGRMDFYAVHLVRKQDKITLEADFRANRIVDLKESIGKKPVALTINGRGILHRSLPKTAGTAAGYLRQILPQAKAADFYLQNNSGTDTALLSLCRKHLADEVVKQLQDAGLKVVSLNLGPFAWSGLGDLFEEETLETNSHSLYFEGSEISSFEATREKRPGYILLGGEQLEQGMLLAFAGGFRAMIGEGGIVHDAVSSMREDFYFKQIFQKMTYAFLGMMLLVLVVNSLLFQHYFGENQSLAAELSVKQTQLEELERLGSQVAEKQAFFKQNNLLENTKSSFFADRIAKSIGDFKIQLTSMKIFPKIKVKNGENQAPSFRNKEILIRGKTKNCLEVNRWNTKLQEKEWLQKASIKDCGEDENGQSHFEMALVIGD